MSLILVDGSALVYRAYYAFANSPLTAPNGELTSVADTHPNTFMAASMVAQLLTEAEPVDRWPREASELLSLFARLPLLAVVDGEI